MATTIVELNDNWTKISDGKVLVEVAHGTAICAISSAEPTSNSGHIATVEWQFYNPFNTAVWAKSSSPSGSNIIVSTED
jgi:hypothetical protein